MSNIINVKEKHNVLEFTGEKGIRILRWNTDSREDAALRIAEFRALSLSLPDSLYL